MVDKIATTANLIRLLFAALLLVGGVVAWAHVAIGGAAQERAKNRAELTRQIEANKLEISVMKAHYQHILTSLEEIKSELKRGNQ